jgi:hypothetical protein
MYTCIQTGKVCKLNEADKVERKINGWPSKGKKEVHYYLINIQCSAFFPSSQTSEPVRAQPELYTNVYYRSYHS